MPLKTKRQQRRQVDREGGVRKGDIVEKFFWKIPSISLKHAHTHTCMQTCAHTATYTGSSSSDCDGDSDVVGSVCYTGRSSSSAGPPSMEKCLKQGKIENEKSERDGGQRQATTFKQCCKDNYIKVNNIINNKTKNSKERERLSERTNTAARALFSTQVPNKRESVLIHLHSK